MKQTTLAQHFKISTTAIICIFSLYGCTHQVAQQATSSAKSVADGYAQPTLESEQIYLEEVKQQPQAQKLVKRLMGSAVAADISQSVPQSPIFPAESPKEQFAKIVSNNIKRASDHPVSTFSLDVDTGSYAVVRRYIQQGSLPPTDAVRIEELINYFGYSYPEARSEEHPFAFATELSPSPWNSKRHVLRVSLAAWKQPMNQLPPSNLVFLVDVSGSMQAANKLPLLKSSLKMLVQQMRPEDSVSLVTYAGQSAVVLEPTNGHRKRKIINAIDSLGAGGGTHGAAGLKDAYRLAAAHKKPNGINRVLLATDGDFNVGLSDTDSLVDYISEQRKAGISLTTLGFGQGNYNDHLMEQLADKGNGNHDYIDTLSEARKVLMEQVGATLYTVAKDSKIQIEFNPSKVSEYRLIGYENRLLREQDFDNDTLDAGDIGAGHTITALYEVALLGHQGERLPERRYTVEAPQSSQHHNEIAWIKLRYKPRGSEVSTLLEHKIEENNLTRASLDLRFSSAVAAWGEWLRNSESGNDYSIEDIIALAESAKGEDNQGYRTEFIQLAKLSAVLR